MTTLEDVFGEYRPSWFTRAMCRRRGIPTSAFFPGKHDAGSFYAAMRPICWSCAVRLPCLDDALKAEGSDGPSYRYGMFGAMSPKERHAEYRRRLAA